jgi:hypothetical protein
LLKLCGAATIHAGSRDNRGMTSSFRSRPVVVALLALSACGDDGTAATSADESSTGDTNSTMTSFTVTSATTATTLDSGEAEVTTDPTATTGTETSGEETTVSPDSSGTDPSETATTTEGSTSTEGSTTDGGSTETGTDGTTGTTGTSTDTGVMFDLPPDDMGGMLGCEMPGFTDGFPDAQIFGDDVLELDLPGTWGLNWDPPSGFDSVLMINMDGTFDWLETSADCTTSDNATGTLWVEGNNTLAMHFDTWEGPLPWDTDPVLGETFPAPFQIRMLFSLQGSGLDDYMVLSGPPGLTRSAPYTAEGYLRLTTEGIYIGGDWHGEGELWDIPAGGVCATTIVRDYFDALLDPETDPLDPQGGGIRVFSRQFFPVPDFNQIFDQGNWTCLGGCAPVSGETLIDGNNLYEYGPYGGSTRLITFESGRAFRRDVGTDCP